MSNSLITLCDGDGIYTDTVIFVVERGEVCCDLDTGIYKFGDDVILTPVSYDELCHRHDAGKKIFETSPAYIGLWRTL